MNRPTTWFAGLVLPTVLLLVGALPTRALAAQESDAAKKPPVVLVVTIEGTISGKTVALVNRGIREAKSLGVRHLLLEISSKGGELEAIRRVQNELRVLKNEEVSTVAFIDEFAFSAAAMIALNCDRIFMKPGAAIGAITPVQVNPLTGEVQDIPSDIRRKQISAVQKLTESAIEGTERDTPMTRLLLRAMVDPDVKLYEVTYREEGKAFDTTNVVVEESELERMRSNPEKYDFRGKPEPIELTAHPLTLTPDEADRYGIARKADSLEAVCRDYLIVDMDDVSRLQENWSEGFVAWLNEMRSVLFVLGFILLLIELKTPGFALPGILGVVMFGLAFFGSYMVGLAEISEILLFFLGLALLATEIFFFPGTVVFGVAGFVCIVSGLILSQQSFVIPANDTESTLMVDNFRNFGLILLVVMLGTWAIYANIHRIPILRSAVQTPPEPHAAGTGIEDAAEARLAQLKGRDGIVACDLRPAGWMEIDGERFDVVSEGSFVPKGSEVTVVEVRGNRVVVAPSSSAPSSSAASSSEPASANNEGPAGPGAGIDPAGETQRGHVGIRSLRMVSAILLMVTLFTGTAFAGAAEWFPSAPGSSGSFPVMQDSVGESGVSMGFLIMLVLIGLALVVAEIFFVSFGILAVLSGVALVTAVFLAFTRDTTTGVVFLLVCAVGVPLAVKYAFRMLPYTPFGRQFYLAGSKHEEVTGGAQEHGLERYLDKPGVALCDLRPAGFAEIEGRRVDVITRGEMLEKDSPLKVIRIETNQVVVALDDRSNGTA